MNCTQSLLAAVVFTASLALNGQIESRAATQAAHGPMNIDFPGGTALQYVEAVRKAAGEVNVVVLTDLKAVSVPQVQLRSVDAGTALRVLQNLPGEQLANLSQIRVFEEPPAAQGHEPVLTIVGKGGTRPAAPHNSSLVMSVSDVFNDELKPADLLTAIEAAVELAAGQHEPAQVRFHESTGLLIARGDIEQIAIIENVVSQLREAKDRDASRAGNIQRMEKALADANEAIAKMSQMQTQLEAAHRHAAEFKTRSELLERELIATKNTLMETEARLRHMMMENQKSGGTQKSNPQ